MVINPSSSSSSSDEGSIEEESSSDDSDADKGEAGGRKRKRFVYAHVSQRELDADQLAIANGETDAKGDIKNLIASSTEESEESDEDTHRVKSWKRKDTRRSPRIATIKENTKRKRFMDSDEEEEFEAAQAEKLKNKIDATVDKREIRRLRTCIDDVLTEWYRAGAMHGMTIDCMYDSFSSKIFVITKSTLFPSLVCYDREKHKRMVKLYNIMIDFKNQRKNYFDFYDELVDAKEAEDLEEDCKLFAKKKGNKLK